MKVTAIRTYVIDCFRTNWVFVKVETDEGLPDVQDRHQARSSRVVSMAKKLLLLALLPLVLSGCMWGRMRINDPTVADRARMVRPGVTRGDQVADVIGAQPTMRLPGKDQTLFGYTYGDTKSHGLMLILVNFTRSTTVTDTLYVQVDNKTGLVTDVHHPPHHDIEWRWWPFEDD